jgi:HK97 family phage major capsid protein
MSEPYFPEKEALALFQRWQTTGDIDVLNSLLLLCVPVAERLIAVRQTYLYEETSVLVNNCLIRLARNLRHFDPARGRMYTLVTKICECVLTDSVRKTKRLGEFCPLSDTLLNSLHTNGEEETRDTLADVRHKITKVKTVFRKENELSAQKWLVRNLLATNFCFRRWEAADAMVVVFAISPARARMIYDATLLAIRRTLLEERSIKPVSPYSLTGTRAKALAKYKHGLSKEDFSKLVFLLRNLAPSALLKAGELTLGEVLHGSNRERVLFEKPAELIVDMSQPHYAHSASFGFTVEPAEKALNARNLAIQSPMPAAVVPSSPPRTCTTASTTSASRSPTLLKTEDLSDFTRNLRDLESRGGRKYSLSRALADMVAVGKPQGAVEIEAHAELASLSDRSLNDGTLLVPLSALDGRRDLDSGDSSSLVQTKVSAQVLPFLRYKSICGRLGATLLTLPAGNASIPRMTSTAGAAWAPETGIAASSGPTFDTITLIPSRLTAITRVSRQLLRQASPDVEALVVNDISTAIATELDRVALAGTGTAPQPLGILSLPVNSAGQYTYSKRAPDMIFGGAATWPNVVAFETAIDSGSQAHNDGTYGWAASPDVRAKWMETPKLAGYPEFLWSQPDTEPDGRVAGRKAVASSQLPVGKVIFGRWSDVLLASWESVETQVNPYTYASVFEVEIRTTLLCTVSTRYASSFMSSSDSAAQ